MTDHNDEQAKALNEFLEASTVADVNDYLDTVQEAGMDGELSYPEVRDMVLAAEEARDGGRKGIVAGPHAVIEPTSEDEQPAEPAKASRFAVYDLTHAHFVGKPHDTEKDAKAAIKDYRKSLTPAHDYEVRKV